MCVECVLCGVDKGIFSLVVFLKFSLAKLASDFIFLHFHSDLWQVLYVGRVLNVALIIVLTCSRFTPLIHSYLRGEYLCIKHLYCLPLPCICRESRIAMTFSTAPSQSSYSGGGLDPLATSVNLFCLGNTS